MLLACHGTMKHRSVTHYGYEFLYGSNNIDKSNPLKNKIPSVCDTMIEKMVNGGLMLNRPDQLTVNQYEPGQGINKTLSNVFFLECSLFKIF